VILGRTRQIGEVLAIESHFQAACKLPFAFVLSIRTYEEIKMRTVVIFLTVLLACLLSFSLSCGCGDDDDDDSGDATNDDDDDNDDGQDDDDDDTADDDVDDDSDDDVDDDVDDDINDDVDDDSGDGVWVDSSSGLMWQIAQDCCGPLNEAESYCQNLVLAGHSDWRLPTVSELRSLIRECDNTETGGSCGVTDSCLDSSCYDEVNCYLACTENEGPADGCYWPSELNGTCGWFWSSSLYTNDIGFAWSIYFGFGSIATNDVNATNSMRSRCVR